MEVQYYEVDDENEEDIPDEETNTETTIKKYDRILPRGGITNNILYHSFVVNSSLSGLSSIEDKSK